MDLLSLHGHMPPHSELFHICSYEPPQTTAKNAKLGGFILSLPSATQVQRRSFTNVVALRVQHLQRMKIVDFGAKIVQALATENSAENERAERGFSPSTFCWPTLPHLHHVQAPLFYRRNQLIFLLCQESTNETLLHVQRTQKSNDFIQVLR